MAILKFNIDPNAKVEGVEATDFSPKASRGGKFIESGTHDVTIFELAMEPTENMIDPTFVDVCYTLVDTDGHSIRKYLKIPTTTEVLFGEQASNREKRDLDFFLRALGVEVNNDNFFSIVPKLFTDPAVLVGMKLTIDCGFFGNHVKFMGPKLFGAFDKDGVPLMSDGKPITGTSKDEAVALVKRAGLADKNGRVGVFAQILRMRPTSGAEGQLDHLLGAKPKVTKVSALKVKAPF